MPVAIINRHSLNIIKHDVLSLVLLLPRIDFFKAVGIVKKLSADILNQINYLIFFFIMVGLLLH